MKLIRKKLEKLDAQVISKASLSRSRQISEEYREINMISFQQNFHNLIGHFKGGISASETVLRKNDLSV